MSFVHAMSAPFKSSPVEFNQRQLFPSHIFDLLPENHECYLYADLFQQLDTSTLESGYSVKGQHAYHPKQIISILIYAYSRGVFSSRQTERRCREDLSFMFIAQMHCPNFRVLSDFRKDHGAFFQDCFKQTVKLTLALKLASFICPEGQVLTLKRQGQDGSRVYQGASKVCAACPLQSRCCQSAKGEVRTLNTDDKEPLRQQMNSKMATESAKVVYRQRKTIVEPVFGQLKNSGFRGFSVRGKEKVAGEFSRVCATHNIKKIAKAIFTGIVRPEWSHLTANPAI